MRIQTLGCLSFQRQGTEIRQLLERPVRAAVLVVLGVERQLTRDRLMGLIWPDRDPGRARHALNQTLYLIRRDLGRELLLVEGERVRASPVLRCDVQDFREAMTAERWEEAVGHYGGDFLDGWYLSGGHALEEWVEHQRATLRLDARRAFRGRIASTGMTEVERALEAARRWTHVDPREDEAHYRVIELYARLGDRSGALRCYDEYRRVLAEAELEPLEEATALAEAIRAEASASSDISEEPSGPTNASGIPDRAGPGSKSPGPATPARPRWRVAVPVAFATVALTALVASALLQPSAGDAPVVSHRILVTPLVNETGAPSLDPVGRLAGDWIIRVLADAGFLEVVPAEAVVERERPRADPAGPNTAAAPAPLDLARSNRAGLLLSGRYYRRGGGLELHATLLDTRTDRVVESVGPVRSMGPDPMPALDTLGQRVLIALAAHLESELGTVLAEGTVPPTYDAFRAYRDGIVAFGHSDWAASIRHMREAREKSPGFVAPLVFEGFAEMNRGHRRAADSIARLAHERRDRLTRYDALRLDILRAAIAGDFQAKYAAARAAARIQPGGTAHFAAGQAALEAGRPRESLEIMSHWDPRREPMRPWVAYWEVVTSTLHVLRQHETELARAREARNRVPERATPLFLEARALAALGRTRALDSLFEASRTQAPPDELLPPRLMLSAAQELAAHGRPASCRELAARSLDGLGDRAGAESTDPWRQQLTARALLLGGRVDSAYATAAALADRHPDRLDLVGFRCALAARAGHPESARRCAAGLTARETYDLEGEVELWRARTAAGLGDVDRAVRLLQEALSQGVAFGVWLHADPLLAPLGDDPIFQDLLHPGD